MSTTYLASCIMKWCNKWSGLLKQICSVAPKMGPYTIHGECNTGVRAAFSGIIDYIIYLWYCTCWSLHGLMRHKDCFQNKLIELVYTGHLNYSKKFHYRYWYVKLYSSGSSGTTRQQTQQSVHLIPLLLILLKHKYGMIV